MRYIYIYIYICLSLSIYIYVYIYMYMYMCVCMYIYIYIYTSDIMHEGKRRRQELSEGNLPCLTSGLRPFCELKLWEPTVRRHCWQLSKAENNQLWKPWTFRKQCPRAREHDTAVFVLEAFVLKLPKADRRSPALPAWSFRLAPEVVHEVVKEGKDWKRAQIY